MNAKKIVAGRLNVLQQNEIQVPRIMFLIFGLSRPHVTLVTMIILHAKNLTFIANN